MSSLWIPRRFRGPERSGNGGWTAGAFASLLYDAGAPVDVTLRRPPPLETPLTVQSGDPALLLDGEVVIAEARRVDSSPAPVPAVGVDEARAAEAHYPGLSHHPFPGCFSCGPESDDGLRIFPGPVAGDGRVAATWTPAQEPDIATVWAALDCVSGWASDLEERPMVLGRMTALVHRLPLPGVTTVVVGRVRGLEGRRTLTASTLWTDGEPLAVAEHVWIQVDPAAFN